MMGNNTRAHRNAIVLMTALVPTTGHADLIDFSASLPETHVWVLIQGRSFEPVPLNDRVKAMQTRFKMYENVTVQGSEVDDAPQNPEDMPDGFWEWWSQEIRSNFPEVSTWDYVVASESYGANVAHALGSEFLPYDLARTLNPARGTNIRMSAWDQWDQIIPEFRGKLAIKATLFGQESVGKTTLSKKVSQELKSTWLMEYARPYLEAVGKELTHAKMDNIFRGQSALQSTNFRKALTPACILDTDLYSTIGYYRILGWEIPAGLLFQARALASDVYYVLPDADVPFEADQLRYGGNKRESTRQFWIDLLEEFNCPYVLVGEGSSEEKTQFIKNDILVRFQHGTQPIRSFQRE